MHGGIKKKHNFTAGLHFKQIIMLFLHGVIKGKKGYTVKVDISHPTKVKLISNKEFRNYKMNKPYRFYGGFFEDSPAYIPFPSSGVWHVVVEKGSLKNPLPVTAKVEVIQGVFTNENPPSKIAPMPEPVEETSEMMSQEHSMEEAQESVTNEDSAEVTENEETAGEGENPEDEEKKEE